MPRWCSDQLRRRWNLISMRPNINTRSLSCATASNRGHSPKSRSSTCARSSRKPARSRSSRASWLMKSRTASTGASRRWCCSIAEGIRPWCSAAPAASRSSARTAPLRSLITSAPARWNVITAGTWRRCRNSASIAAASMSISSAPAQRNWKSCCTASFPRRALAAWTAIRFVAGRILSALHEHEIDLLVGTQMIAKGHDIHGVTLVGVVGADIALGMPDFRAAERTFQLLTQVAGRAGRGYVPGKVVLQTYFPDHYAVQYAAQHDFAGFYDKELRFRSWMHYPPYSALANVLVRSNKLDDALRWSGLLGRWFESTRHESVRILGPAPAPIVRLKEEYRYHFVLKSPSREKLNNLLRSMLSYAAIEKIPRT